MTRVNNDNFIVIQGYMINELNLKGNELLVYAIINGFSQAESQTFSGSLQYLADWTNSTKQGVIKCLKSLQEKGLIGKKENIINGVKFCEYYSTKFNTLQLDTNKGSQQSLTPIQQSLPNKIEDNISLKDSKKESKKESYDDIIANNFNNEAVINTLKEFIKMRKFIKKPLTDFALTKLCNKLKKFSDVPATQVAILEQSILNNWQDIYELKGNNTQANNKKAPVSEFNGVAEAIRERSTADVKDDSYYNDLDF